MLAAEAMADAAINLATEYDHEMRRRKILFRVFPPFSSPPPYSHEQEPEWDVWQSPFDCLDCPYRVGWLDCRALARWSPRLQKWKDGIIVKQYEILTWGRCRFTEYRRILFLRFERFTEEA